MQSIQISILLKVNVIRVEYTVNDKKMNVLYSRISLRTVIKFEKKMKN